jgi:hypothetical protein
MYFSFPFDRVQFFGILFSIAVFGIIITLVKKRRIKEEYSLLWLALSLVFIYLSLDRWAIDRLADLVGIAYKPSVLILIVIGFMTLILVHITVVITRLSEQNRELTQQIGLNRLPSPTDGHPEILIIIPAYNEAENIAGVIQELKSIELPCDLIVVNDGSRDMTSAVAATMTRVIDLPSNLGIGGAVQTGFKYAYNNGYQIAVQFDGDGQHIAAEIPNLLQSMQESNADMVIGSRFLRPGNGFRSTILRRIGIRIFELLNSLLIGQRITDNTSGFRVYNRQAIEFLANNYPIDFPEPETVILLGKNGFRIIETFTQMRERKGGNSSITGLTGAYYMIKVVLAVLVTALRKPSAGTQPHAI